MPASAAHREQLKFIPLGCRPRREIFVRPLGCEERSLRAASMPRRKGFQAAYLLRRRISLRAA